MKQRPTDLSHLPVLTDALEVPDLGEAPVPAGSAAVLEGRDGASASWGRHDAMALQEALEPVVQRLAENLADEVMEAVAPVLRRMVREAVQAERKARSSTDDGLSDLAP